MSEGIAGDFKYLLQYSIYSLIFFNDKIFILTFNIYKFVRLFR